MATTRPPPDWIAELRVIIVHPDGHRVPGHIAVGRPYTLAGADPAAPSFESHCPIEVDGIHSAQHPIIGGGTLGALLSALQFLGTILQNFISRGGRILDPEDESDVPLALLFGPMMREISGT